MLIVIEKRRHRERASDSEMIADDSVGTIAKLETRQINSNNNKNSERTFRVHFRISVDK